MPESPTPERISLTKPGKTPPPPHTPRRSGLLWWAASAISLGLITLAVMLGTRHPSQDAALLTPPAARKPVQVTRQDPRAERAQALLNQPNLGPQLVTFITPQGERLLYRTRKYEVACLVMLTGRTTMAGPTWLLARNANGWAKLNVATASAIRTQLPPPTREQQDATVTFNVCGQFRRLPAQTPEQLRLDDVPLPSGGLLPEPVPVTEDDGVEISIGLDGRPTIGY